MNVTVSVVVTTFRHERFVEQALQSVLAQRTDFAFEVVVGVDAADDSTLAIVRGLERDHPSVLRVLAHSHRVGLFRNFSLTYAAARGQFIALLEGDDYWCSPTKLATQIALLRSDPRISLCGHATSRVDISGRPVGRIPVGGYLASPRTSDFLERLCDFHTSSLCFPDPFSKRVPEVLLDERTRAFDLGLKFVLASRGHIGYIDDELSAFREVPGSASSDFDEKRVDWLRAMSLSLRLARPLVSRGHRGILDHHVGRLELAVARDSTVQTSRRLAALARSAWASPAPLARALVAASLRPRLKRRGTRTP